MGGEKQMRQLVLGATIITVASISSGAHADMIGAAAGAGNDFRRHCSGDSNYQNGLAHQ
jgi:hypothetical protein